MISYFLFSCPSHTTIEMFACPFEPSNLVGFLYCFLRAFVFHFPGNIFFSSTPLYHILRYVFDTLP